MRRIVISSAKSLFPTLFGYILHAILILEAVQARPLLSNAGMLSSKSSRTHFVAHTSSNDCRTDLLLQTFKVRRFDLKRLKQLYSTDGGASTDVLRFVQKEQSATPVPLTPLPRFVLFAWRGSLFERPGHKSTPLDTKAFATMLRNF